jgi:hypothetical protein
VGRQKWVHLVCLTSPSGGKILIDPQCDWSESELHACCIRNGGRAKAVSTATNRIRKRTR